jgi:uncharacterized membrane protein YesL
MMGLFFGNYDRPGPGVRKDAPPQKAIPRFFSIFQRKFFDLCKLNLLFCIPVAVIGALCFWLNSLFPYPAVDFLPVILLYPFLAGLTFVTRNYAREEHAFIFSDFKDAVKNNWVSFLLDGILCYVVFLVMSISIPFYWNAGGKNILYAVGAGLCVMISLLFVFSQYYVPVMLVTFNLKFSQVLKNSFIFAILGVGRNFMLTGLLLLLVFLLYLAPVMGLTILLAILFALFLMFSYCSFLINFAVYPLIDKYMIKPRQDAGKDENGGGGKMASDFKDSL